MKFGLNKIAVILLLLTVYSAGAEGALSINGKNLDAIDDIVSETTGGTLSLPKHSLLIAEQITPRLMTTNLQLIDVQLAQNGTAAHTYNLSGFGKYNGETSSLYPVASSRADKNGRFIFIPDAISENNNVIVTASLACANSSPALTQNVSIQKNVCALTPDTRFPPSYFLQDAQGGLFLPDHDEEFFAVSTVRNTRLTATNSGWWCSNAISIFGARKDNDGKISVFDTGVMIESDLETNYSVSSIATGDFTGTGSSNQIALAVTDKSGIYISLYTLKVDGEKYSYDTVKRYETVYLWQSANMKSTVIKDFTSYPAVEIVAGDFDGDSKTELAVVYKDDASNISNSSYGLGKINVAIYKWNNGSFKKESASTSYDYRDYSYFLRTTETAGIVGLRAAKADFDGDGKDELAVLLIAFCNGFYRYENGYTDELFFCPYLARWYCDRSSITPKYDASSIKGKGIKYGALKERASSKVLFGKDPDSGNDYGVLYYRKVSSWSDSVTGIVPNDYPYVSRTFTMTAGPFNGTIGKTKTCDDVVIGWAGDVNYLPATSRCAYMFKTNLDSSRNFSSFADGTELYYNHDKYGVMGLAHADILGEGVELDAPVHLKVNGRRSYAAVIQTPPYHVDYIPLPWNTNQTSQLINCNYDTDLKSTYSHKTTTSTAQDVTFEMERHFEGIEALNVGDGTINAVRTAASFKGINIPNELTDKITSTTTKANESSYKIVMTEKIETGTSDRIFYYDTAMHIWRYPVKYPVPSWLLGEVEEGDKRARSGDIFITFTMCDDPVRHSTAGFDDDNYQPLHEEGNLFSYPTSLTQIPGYNGRQLTFGIPGNFSYSPGEDTAEIKITANEAQKTTTSKVTTYGTISKTVGTVKVLAGKASENAMVGTTGKTDTFTKSYSTTDTLKANFPNPERQANDYKRVTFSTMTQAYSDEAGILTLGFAINQFGSDAMLWNNSIYNQKPDPSFYLPYKYYFSGSDGGSFKARTEGNVATKMRGVRFYIPDASVYTNSVLMPGVKYRIEVPIYNASFVAPSVPVEVALSYRRNGDMTPTLIEKQSVTIGGWETGKETNKAVVSFDWTIDNNIVVGNYDLIAEIDPDNKINEVHEAWSRTNPGGNNTGYVKCFITGNQKGGSEEKENIDFKIDGRTLKDFLAYGSSQTEPFDAEGSVVYSGNLLIEDAWIEVCMTFSDDVEVATATRNIYGMNYEDKYNFTFTINPEDLRECTKLYARLYTSEYGTIEFAEDHTPSSSNNASTLGSTGGGCNSAGTPLALALIFVVSKILLSRRGS